MQFYNDTSKQLSLYHDTLGILGIHQEDTTSYPISDFTRNANEAYKDTNQKIWRASGAWSFDDSNYTDLPSATTALVESQKDYQIPSYAQKIDRLEVLDSSGGAHKVIPIDKSEVSTSLSGLFTSTGLPTYYDIEGSQIMLYPSPDATSCTLTAGLRLFFTRDIDEFLITDTTKQPGFVEDFHRSISLGAALYWAIPRQLPCINDIKAQINAMDDKIMSFYGSRDRDLKTTIRPPKRLIR